MKRGLTGFDSNSSLISVSRDVMITQNKANFVLLQSVSDNNKSVFGISCNDSERITEVCENDEGLQKHREK